MLVHEPLLCRLQRGGARRGLRARRGRPGDPISQRRKGSEAQVLCAGALAIAAAPLQSLDLPPV